MLESGMDFRDNWLTNFRAVVDQEIREANGDPVAGRTVVAQKLEKAEQTIYQHYGQKSGKQYPTVEMMVLLEKKYGAGRPHGWSAAPTTTGNSPPPGAAPINQIKLSHPVLEKLERATSTELLIAENLLRALFGLGSVTESQRQLLLKMLREAVPDEVAAKHLPPAPKSESSRNKKHEV